MYQFCIEFIVSKDSDDNIVTVIQHVIFSPISLSDSDTKSKKETELS